MFVWPDVKAIVSQLFICSCFVIPYQILIVWIYHSRLRNILYKAFRYLLKDTKPISDLFRSKYKSALANDKIRSARDFSIVLKPEKNISKEIRNKGKRTSKLLELEGLYNKHKLEALKIIEQQFMFKDEYINDQIAWKDPVTGIKPFMDKAHYIKTAFDFKLQIEDYGQGERAKFKRDLAEHMGLNFP